MIDGGVTVGPNAVLGFAREGYRKLSFNSRDVLDYAAFPGMWRMARGMVRIGAVEMRNSLWKRGYEVLPEPDDGGPAAMRGWDQSASSDARRDPGSRLPVQGDRADPACV